MNNKILSKWKDMLVFFKPTSSVQAKENAEVEEPLKKVLALQDMNLQIRKQNVHHYSKQHPHSSKWAKSCAECALLERLTIFLFQSDAVDLPMQIEPMPWANFVLKTLVDVDSNKRRMAFLGENPITKQQVFVKIQNVYTDCDPSSTVHCYFRNQGIETEVAMLHYVKGLPFLPYLLDHGVHLQSKYLVVECLGPSLSTLRKNEWLYPTKQDHPLLKQAKLFAKSHDMVCVAQQLVHRLQMIHKFDLLHKDIKPDNICFGVGQHSNQVYLVDFETAWHPSFFSHDYQTEHHIFTPYYASPYVNTGSYHWRDELISLGYVLMSMFSPLPWYKIENSLTRTQCKCMDSSEQVWKIHQNRETMKREMFYQAKDGTIKFTGHHAMGVGTRLMTFKKVMEKRSMDMYPFFVRYFDILFNQTRLAPVAPFEASKAPLEGKKPFNVYRALQEFCNETRVKLEQSYYHFCLPLTVGAKGTSFAFQQHYMWTRCPCTGRFIIFYKKF